MPFLFAERAAIMPYAPGLVWCRSSIEIRAWGCLAKITTEDRAVVRKRLVRSLLGFVLC